MEELRQVALDLLDEWESVSQDGIYEWSGHVTEDLASLKREVAELRARIVNIT